MIIPISDGAATHLQPIVECALRSNGSILECGAGYFSSPILHAIGAIQDRHVITLETSGDWIETMSYLMTKSHTIQHIKPQEWVTVIQDTLEWMSTTESVETKVGFAFVDAYPPDARKDIIAILQDVPLVLIHDTEINNNPVYRLENVLKSFKWRRDWCMCGIRTTLVSNHVDLFEAWGKS